MNALASFPCKNLMDDVTIYYRSNKSMVTFFYKNDHIYNYKKYDLFFKKK
jgi:hypothetical protein